MIAENELRVGNWYLDSSGELEQVKSIYDGYVNPDISMHTLEIDGDTFENIKPIPLTSEIFEQCGFARYDYYRDRWAYLIGEKYFIAGEWFHLITKDGAIVLNYNVKHLHQLQNLYFTLTGKELDVKL